MELVVLRKKDEIISLAKWKEGSILVKYARRPVETLFNGKVIINQSVADSSTISNISTNLQISVKQIKPANIIFLFKT